MRLVTFAMFLLTPLAYAQTSENVQSFYPGGTPLSAECNGKLPSQSGSSATADLAAFNAAAAAAHAVYISTLVPVKIFFGGNCILTGQVNMSGGEQFDGSGGGVITVPSQQAKYPATNYTFVATDADQVAWDNMIINVASTIAGDYAGNTVILWASSTGGAHYHVYARNNVINNSGWGMLIEYNSGSASGLTDVVISGNRITNDLLPPLNSQPPYTLNPQPPYTNGDGIHLEGNVSNITISDNHIINRGDACIGLTPLDGYAPNNFLVANNTCFQDRVGIDISGANNGTVVGNYVSATEPGASGSSPAYRIIADPASGVLPFLIHTKDNYFQAAPASGGDSNVKLDISGGASACSPTPGCYFDFSGNVYATVTGVPSLYINDISGNAVSISDETFEPGGILTVYDSQSVDIGTNHWLGNGTLNVNGTFSDIQVSPQDALGTLTHSNSNNEVIPNELRQTVSVPGCTFTAFANGNVCYQTVTLPQQHTDSNFVVSCEFPTPLTGQGGEAPVISYQANPLNKSQFNLYEQSIIATSTWESYPNYEINAVCTSYHP